ncbi:MAG TPA: hypothetical protein V6C97_09290 [Oculatellaceae cyanobacterium]
MSILRAIAGDVGNLRGARYGEVLLGRGGLLIPSEFDVFNTIGLNDCPQDQWSKLDAEQIKKQYGVKAVKLNGPRYWMIDGMTNSKLVSKQTRMFGGLEMREAGILKLSLKDKVSLGKPYAVHKVARTTTWVYRKGLPVYQLIAPDEAVYFMQSFSVQKENQTIDSLPQLGSKLHLPSGWSYRTVTLSDDYLLKAENGEAYVVQDDLDDTYQRSTVKFDAK